MFALTNRELQKAALLRKDFGKLKCIDTQLVRVLCMAGDPSGPRPGREALASSGGEQPGQLAALEAHVRVGARVIHEILGQSGRYARVTPRPSTV